MGSNLLLSPTDTGVTVPAGDSISLPQDQSPALQSADSGGHRGTKRRVRVGAVFQGTPPSSDAFFLRVVEGVGGEDIAVAVANPTATEPGTGNAVPAGVWQISGPIPSNGFLRFVNETTSDHTLTEVLAVWEDV